MRAEPLWQHLLGHVGLPLDKDPVCWPPPPLLFTAKRVLLFWLPLLDAQHAIGHPDHKGVIFRLYTDGKQMHHLQKGPPSKKYLCLR